MAEKVLDALTLRDTKSGTTTEYKIQDSVLKARVDALTKLEEGSTTGDAELQDIRVDYKGTTHENAGDAVRASDQALNDKIDDEVSKLKEDIDNIIKRYQFERIIYHVETSQWVSSNNRLCMRKPEPMDAPYIVTCENDVMATIRTFADPSDESSLINNNLTGYSNRLVIPVSDKYFSISIKHVDESPIKIEEASKVQIRNIYTIAEINNKTSEINNKTSEIDTKIAKSDKKIELIEKLGRTCFIVHQGGTVKFETKLSDWSVNVTITDGIYLRGRIEMSGTPKMIKQHLGVDTDYFNIPHNHAFVYDTKEQLFKIINFRSDQKEEYVVIFVASMGRIVGGLGAYLFSGELSEKNSKEIDSLTSRAEKIEDLIENLSPKGNVYTDEVNDVVSKVEAILKESNAPMLTLAIFTDLHHDNKYVDDPIYDMMQNIKALDHKLHFDGIYNLGDAIDGQFSTKTQAEEYLSDVINKMGEISNRCHSLEGNHDDNVQSTWTDRGGYTESERLTNLELHQSINKISNKEIHNGGRFTDYYIDYDDYGIRIIALGVNYTSFQESTATWLNNIALNTNKSVLILAHCPTRKEWSVYNDVVNGSAIESAIKDFMNKGGEIIGYIHGHVHGDEINTTDDLKYSEISIGCAKFEENNYGLTLTTIPKRNSNDYTKILFDVVCVDKTNKKLHFVRCGAGDDRVISY